MIVLREGTRGVARGHTGAALSGADIVRIYQSLAQEVRRLESLSEPWAAPAAIQHAKDLRDSFGRIYPDVTVRV